MDDKKKKPCPPTPDCESSLTANVKTEDGQEQVHIDMETGRITYGPTACADNGKDGKEKRHASGGQGK